jgi:hypothetical protein
MKKILLLLGITLCIGNGAVLAQPPELTGYQILQKTLETYAALPSYSGGTAVISQANFEGGMQILSTSTAMITFKRSGTLHIAGQLSGGNPYHLDGDDKGATLTLNYTPGNKGSETTEKYKNVTLAISAATGIAQSAPTIISGALLNWNYIFLNKDKDASLLGNEKIGEVDCYKIIANTSTPGSLLKRTYWIDTKSFLLVQMRDEQKIDWKKFQQSLPKQYQPKIKTSAMLSTMTLYVFTNDKTFGGDPTNQ